MSATLLDMMKADAEKQAEELVQLANPDNAAQVFHCKVPTDGLQVEALANAAEKVDKGRGTATYFHRALVAACVESIAYAGTTVELGGLAVNFRDPELQDHLQVKDARDAVKALMVKDGSIRGLAESLLEAGGWGDGSKFLDPTRL